MAKKYTGSLTLEWYNKQKAILLTDSKLATDIPAPSLNWVNKDEALFYEIYESEGRGLKPYWVDRSDIRVKESRPLILQKTFKAELVDRPGTIPGTDQSFQLVESDTDDSSVSNILIKGDNLLALNSLKKSFEGKPENDKVKCIYIDPPYNTDSAFVNQLYDDNLEHSEWLTMMRDRLTLLRDLLREDGYIVVHLDDKEAAYCKAILDEIFGRANYCNQISVSTNKAFGFKSTSKDLFKQANQLLFYAKNKEVFELKKIYVEKEYDPAYKLVFVNTDGPKEEWQWANIQDVVAQKLGYEDARAARKHLPKDELDLEISLFALDNAEKVFQTAAPSGGAFLKRKATILKSKDEKNKIMRHPGDDMDYLFIGGRRVIFYSERIVELDGNKVAGEIITDIWNDISLEGLSHEGGVDFPKSKKPEKLIERVIELGTQLNDVVLDIFGGSGTTFAVAHKMGRRWIGVELGTQADDIIIPRLKGVTSGEDQSGVSKSRLWNGGSSFKYYHLGPSIITFNDKGEADFNWSLGKSFLEESFLSSYDYTLVADTSFLSSDLFADKETLPKIGIQQVGSKYLVAVVSLNAPDGPQPTISFDELRSLYAALKAKFAPQYINVFTNRGVELAYDSKPDDLEVIKIPYAIFAELEK